MDDTDTARIAASRAGSAEVKTESPDDATVTSSTSTAESEQQQQHQQQQHHHQHQHQQHTFQHQQHTLQHQPGQQQQSAPLKRTVCDHCRRRRIRCDGKFPCEQCVHASLTCKREHVPKKRGPKRGHGRVINELRARESSHQLHQLPQHTIQKPFNAENALESPTDVDIGMSSSDLGEAASQPSSNASAASTPPSFWAAVTSNPGHSNVPEPRGVFSSDEFRPRTRSYFHMIPQLVELYYEHIYPIMPLIYMPAIRETISRPMTPSEKNLVYALCALTSMHMSGKSIGAPGPTSWEVVGRFFLDETISTRHSYDFLEDLSLSAVISSFYLSTSFFEINQSRKSWYYLREALTNAQDLGLQDDSTYYGLSREETLCRQRVFWILFVTERSFAILRNKPITFKRTPSLPSTRHSYEGPDIHAGFLQLVSSYTPLDESFVTAWNEGSDPRVSATTFLALQNLLSLPPAFLRPRGRSSPPQPHSQLAGSFGASSDAQDSGSPEPTNIQKADLLITQQWLRLIVWQSSMRQGLLSWTNPADSSGSVSPEDGVTEGNSMCFSFPLTVARDTAAILSSLPSKAVEVHGMGIMEKIFEIGTWCVNVLGACESVGFSTSMDFTSGDMGVLGSGRKGASLDPIEFFVRTLSASDNSRKQFAEKLLTAAGENPGSMRTQLSPAMSGMGASAASAAAAAAAMMASSQGPNAIDATGWGQQRGSVVGEVFEENEENSNGNTHHHHHQQQQQPQQQLGMGGASIHHHHQQQQHQHQQHQQQRQQHHSQQSGMQGLGLGIDLGTGETTGGLGGVDMDASSVDLMSPLGLTRSNTSDMATMGMPGFETAWSPSSGGTGPREFPDYGAGPFATQREGGGAPGYAEMGSGLLMHDRMVAGGGTIGGPVGGESPMVDERHHHHHQQADNGPYDTRRENKNLGYQNGARVGLWLGT
ncbi:hypothetical protein CDEST_08744 [Colletotrichum destructivum]|uniref:Zn(2)-C6 fungal-type domain-containing protein n=1 Tax=Colletotrichum destructivum TaxID=34406 RepID=A0AAX4IL32_9PEZI|nr:hypothetical protein CDEST_08744 [Colletotrichum destructivum]